MLTDIAPAGRVSRLAMSVVAAVVCAASVAGQSLYTIDGTPAPPIIDELTGPPAGACGYPIGPVISGFPAVAGACAGLVPFAAPLGDVAVDPVTDLIYASDGGTIAVYTSAGAFVDSFPAPLAVVGMGIDPAGGPLLWITDGVTYGAIAPPAVPCSVVAPPFAPGGGPFPVPMGPGFFLSPINDLTWDAATGSLLACDGLGVVGDFFPGPVFVAGPYGFFAVSPGVCGLGLLLTGIVIDRAFPGSGAFYVSDGATVAYLLPPGGAAPLTFYRTATCSPVPAPTSDGLGYAGRGILYGAAADNMGGTPPTISAVGQSYVGNAGFTIALSGSVAGSTAFCIYSLAGAPCPAPLILGVPLNLVGPLFAVGVGTVLVGVGGTATIAAPISPTIPPGTPVWIQWAVFTPTGGLQSTEGLEITVIAP